MRRGALVTLLAIDTLYERGEESPYSIKQLRDFLKGEGISGGLTYEGLRELMDKDLIEVTTSEAGEILIYPRPISEAKLHFPVFLKCGTGSSATEKILRYLADPVVPKESGWGVAVTGVDTAGWASPITKLLRLGYIERVGSGKYIVTEEGKRYLEELDRVE